MWARLQSCVHCSSILGLCGHCFVGCCDVPGGYQVAQPLRGVGFDLVVVSGHARIGCQLIGGEMDGRRFRVDDFEYSFHAVKTPEGWTTQVVRTNHGVTPLEETRIDGDRLFLEEEEALAFAENLARDLAASHFR